MKSGKRDQRIDQALIGILALINTHQHYFGKSSASFRLKKFRGFNSTSCQTVGNTGQSSELGTWCSPIVYHTTISVFSIARLAFVHAGKPSPPLL